MTTVFVADKVDDDDDDAEEEEEEEDDDDDDEEEEEDASLAVVSTERDSAEKGKFSISRQRLLTLPYKIACSFNSLTHKAVCSHK